MKKHEYSLFYRLIYKFANIPLTLLLALYLVFWAGSIDRHIIYVVPFGITLLIIYLLNKHYLMLYKIMPFRIESDDEKLVCSGFFLSQKKVVIYYSNIEKLEGGLFGGKPRGIMKVYDRESKVHIGFYQNIRGGRELGTLILSKVPRSVYDEVLDKVNKNSGRKA